MIKLTADMNVIINSVVRSNGYFIRREDIRIAPEVITELSPTTVSTFGFLFNQISPSVCHLTFARRELKEIWPLIRKTFEMNELRMSLANKCSFLNSIPYSSSNCQSNERQADFRMLVRPCKL